MDIQYFSTNSNFKKNYDINQLIETEVTKTVFLQHKLVSESISIVIGFMIDEKKLAILKEQQLEQLASLNSQQTEEQEETNFWLQILEGVAEGLADPNTWENARQNAEIQRLKNACRRTRSC